MQPLEPFPTIHITDSVDLHLHTRAYDGLWTPRELVDYVHGLGIKVLAVADHDTLANVAVTIQLAREKGLIAIPATEATVIFEGVVQHLLLYGIDIENDALLTMLAEERRRNRESAEQGVTRLRQQGIALPDLEAMVAGRELMPSYVIGALRRGRYAATITEAISIAEGAGISFTIATDMAHAIDVAHQAGGVAVLAHPGRAEMWFEPVTFHRLERMIAVGLDGLEVYHGLHSARDVAAYGRFAREHDLLISCGSDSHGPRARTKPIPWPASQCRALLERCGITVIDDGPRTSGDQDSPPVGP